MCFERKLLYDQVDIRQYSKEDVVFKGILPSEPTSREKKESKASNKDMIVEETF